MNTINVKSFAGFFNAYLNCQKSGNKEWENRHMENIEQLCEALPHGSGLDGKCEFQPENSKPEKLVFFFEFHHMNEYGYYDGWSDHSLIITPSLQFGYNMRITGRNKGNVKEYLYDLFANIFE